LSALRRDFLRGAAAAAALSSANRGKAAGNERANLGFIGVGVRGAYLLAAFLELPDANAVGAADLYDAYLRNAREMCGGKLDTGRDYRRLLDRKDIDAVVISTPDHWHCRMVLDALSAGKDVFCEKPLTWSIAEGIRIQEAVSKSRGIVQVGSPIKTSRATAQVKQLVASGVLGKVISVCRTRCANSEDFAYRWPIPPDASPQTVDWPAFLGSAPKIPWSPERFFRWRCWWEYSGGLATDLMVHDITTVNEILGVALPSSAMAHGGILRWNDGRTVPDTLTAVLEYPDGFQFMLHQSQATALALNGWGNLYVGGTKATLVWGRDLQIVHEPGPPVPRQSLIAWPKEMREQYFLSHGCSSDGKPRTPPPQHRVETIPLERDPSRTLHQALFIKSVKERMPSVETAEEGHNAAAAAHMINMSYRQRRRISLEEATAQARRG